MDMRLGLVWWYSTNSSRVPFRSTGGMIALNRAEQELTNQRKSDQLRYWEAYLLCLAFPDIPVSLVC